MTSVFGVCLFSSVLCWVVHLIIFIHVIWIHYSLFMAYTIDGHFGCFHFGAIVMGLLRLFLYMYFSAHSVLFCWVNGLDLLSHKIYVTELDKVVVPYCPPTSSMWEFQRLHTSHFHSCPPLVCLCHNSGLSKSGHWLLCFSPPVGSHWSQHEMHGVLGLIWFVPVAFPTSCPLYSSTPSCPALVASFLPLSPSSSIRDFVDVVLLGSSWFLCDCHLLTFILSLKCHLHELPFL